MTGGKFFEAADQDALETVYDEIGSQVGVDEEQRELTVLFTAAGAVLLLLGGALDALVRPHSLTALPTGSSRRDRAAIRRRLRQPARG